MPKINKSEFVNADDFIASLPAARRGAIERRATVLMAEELTLRDLRKARDLTQAQIGALLGIGQEHVCRLEQRSDLLLSTLASYVEAMGGELKLMVQFADRPPVALSKLGDIVDTAPATATVKRRPKRRAEAKAA